MKSKIIINELPMLLVILSIVQICLMLVQVAYSVLVYTETVVSDHLYEGGYIALLVVAVFVVNLFILRQVLRTLRRSYALIHTQEETIKNIEALNTRIRAQRHDFLNHIQILYGMAELEEYDELRQYLHKIYGDIETANAFLKTDSVAVNALLQAKSAYAAGRNIAFDVEIGTRLATARNTDMPPSNTSPFDTLRSDTLRSDTSRSDTLRSDTLRSGMPHFTARNTDTPLSATRNTDTPPSGTPLSEWDICRLLGNLIDNALHATAEFSGDKQVQVQLTETLDEFLFTVTNSGAPITPQNRTRLFEPGFTTRLGLGEGMGLYIVKTIAETHRGHVTVSSADQRTAFTVHIPKQNKR